MGIDLPIPYILRTLNKNESNYSATKLECLAILLRVKQFRSYFYGKEFVKAIFHKPLTKLFKLKNPLTKLF